MEVNVKASMVPASHIIHAFGEDGEHIRNLVLFCGPGPTRIIFWKGRWIEWESTAVSYCTLRYLRAQICLPREWDHIAAIETNKKLREKLKTKTDLSQKKRCREKWRIATDRVAWSVCLSVCHSILFVTFMNLAKMAELIQMKFVVLTWVGRRNRY